MTMRPIDLPADIDSLENLACRRFQYPENPDWDKPLIEAALDLGSILRKE